MFIAIDMSNKDGMKNSLEPGCSGHPRKEPRMIVGWFMAVVLKLCSTTHYLVPYCAVKSSKIDISDPLAEKV